MIIYLKHCYLLFEKTISAQLWKYLCQFSKTSKQSKQLYSFIQQAHENAKKQVSIKSFFSSNNNNNKNAEPSTSTTNEEKMEIEFTDDESDVIIESSPKEPKEENIKISEENEHGKTSLLPNNHDTIFDIIRAIDGDIECVTSEKSDAKSTISKRKETAITIDDDDDSENNDSVIIVNEIVENATKVAKITASKSKITHYFSKVDK